MNVFGMMKARMAYETQSLRLSGENMANLHTPNYKARMPTELTFDDALTFLVENLGCFMKPTKSSCLPFTRLEVTSLSLYAPIAS